MIRKKLWAFIERAFLKSWLRRLDMIFSVFSRRLSIIERFFKSSRVDRCRHFATSVDKKMPFVDKTYSRTSAARFLSFLFARSIADLILAFAS